MKGRCESEHVLVSLHACIFIHVVERVCVSGCVRRAESTSGSIDRNLSMSVHSCTDHRIIEKYDYKRPPEVM